ncbi:potassium channel subfamily K member 13-like, partial [Diaphorina citri]|uniref:Potassium channel subfamily K member 13-like n=1 Tax=Diaphorina citri TaxID=121845 RepID=A0A3Q0JKF8_DIACI
LSEDERNESLEEWKPSVYWVMLCLIVASIVIAGCASFVYVPYENWTYLESIYFCFVSFSTIGFGDYVSAQAIDYPNSSLYSFWNYIFLILGCSCIYSLFNVTSIVIKQFLNWLIYEMDMFCCRKPPDKTGRVLRRHSIRVQRERERRRRSSITLPKTIRRERNRPLGRICDVVPQADDDSNGFDENSDGARRLSGELISMKDLLTA